MISHRFLATFGLLASVIGVRAADAPPKLVRSFLRISLPLYAQLYQDSMNSLFLVFEFF